MAGPSRILRALLERLLRAGEEDALGDLDEELDRLTGRTGALATELWYCVEALSLARAVLASRLRGGPGARDASAAHAPRRPTSISRTETMARTLDVTRRDLRQATRGLLGDAGTTAVIVGTLALGVGGTTAIFAVADAAFLRPLPYPEADRLVRVYSGSREDPDAAFALSPLDLRDLEEYDAVIEAIGAWSVAESVHLTGGDEPRRLEAPRASAALFEILGVRPALGRFFTAAEEVPGADDAVLLSHALWVSAFGGDTELVGRSVLLDGSAYRVVGVAPPSGMLPGDADVWRPLALGPEWYDPGRWGWQFLRAVARLRPGVEPAAASALLTARLAEAVPVRVERGQMRVARTLYAERAGSTGRGVLLLLGAVALLLAMACANVMNVMLVRAEQRVREFGLRRALGSGGASLIRLVAIETAVLGALGGLAGLALARFALAGLAGVELAGVAYLDSARVDGRVVAFALVLTVATAALFGLAPVLRALRADPQTVLREGGTRAGGSRAARRMGDGLVVAQVALAGTLLVAVGLSASAFFALVDTDPGFRPGGVLAASIELPADGYDGEAGVAFYRALMEDLRAMPGAEEAGAVQFLPLTGTRWSASIELIDPDPTVTDPDPGGNMRPVAPGYFETMGIPLLEGRTFTGADDTGDRPVVVVDEVLARRYWPGGSPVGRPVVVGALSREPATIVGVVGSVPDRSLAEPGNGHVYFPVLQRAMRDMTLVVRADGDPAALAPRLRDVVRAADPRIPVTGLSTVDELVSGSLAAPRVALLLLTALGGVALLLAAVGIYGVLAYGVARRRGEIGTRMALGAAPRAIVASIVGRSLRLWAAGALLGALGAAAVAEVLSRSVHGVEAADPLPYALALLALGGVAALAALLPALRATSVDPAGPLRAE